MATSTEFKPSNPALSAAIVRGRRRALILAAAKAAFIAALAAVTA